MLSHEILSIHAAMGCLLPRVDVESAELVRLCRRNLLASAEQAEALENTVIVPAGETSCLAGARPPLRGETTGRRS